MPEFTVPPGWESGKECIFRSFRDADKYEWQARIQSDRSSILLVLETWEPVQGWTVFTFHTVQDAINAAEALACGQWLEAEEAYARVLERLKEVDSELY